MIYCYFNCYLIELQTGFKPDGSGTTIRHDTKIRISHDITHHAQTKHVTQNYTNNKGHITHIYWAFLYYD
jgi:hypothetical protein